MKMDCLCCKSTHAKLVSHSMSILMIFRQISTPQDCCVRAVSVVAGIAVRDDAGNAAVEDARTAQEAAMDAAPTKSGAPAAGALALTWRVA